MTTTRSRLAAHPIELFYFARIRFAGMPVLAAGLITVLLLTFAAAPALGQETMVQGRVLERAGLKPVPGATIRLQAHPDLSILTDAKGQFRITYATSALIGNGTARETPAMGGRSRFFSWGEAWRDAAGKLHPETPASHAGYPLRAVAPAAKSAAAADSLAVSCPGLLSKSVKIGGGSQDLGDIVLDYPPRRLDIGAPPIYGSVVLFDGKRATMDAEWEHWMGTYRKANGLAPTPIVWLFVKDPVDTGMTMQTCCRAQWGDEDLVTKRKFRDFQLHVEFNLVAPRPGGGPANSGVYLQSLYEIQIKDDYGMATLGSHDAGGILNEFAAPKNESRPKGQWQAYDITFRAARFTAGVRTEKARLTMYWNGKLVHLDKETANEHNTGVSSDSLTDLPHGLKLQSEGHDIRFRNIWLKELDLIAPNTNLGY